MGVTTSIGWTNSTWNAIRGCNRVSPGCENCYAETVAHRFGGPGQPYEGLIVVGENGNYRWNGVIKTVPNHLLDPMRWKKPRMIFVNSMSDLFHERLSFEEISQIFAVMALCPQHIFQILTKRADRMREYVDYITKRHVGRELMASYLYAQDSPIANMARMNFKEPDLTRIYHGIWDGRIFPLPNVWLGISIENQKYANERIPHLLQTPAAKRWISAEPLLGPINFYECSDTWFQHGYKPWENTPVLRGIDWVVVGGESGPGARPMHPEWAREIHDVCSKTDTPFFFKQWGAFTIAYEGPNPETAIKNKNTQWLNYAGGCGFHGDKVVLMERVGKKNSGNLLDGNVYEQYPKNHITA